MPRRRCAGHARTRTGAMGTGWARGAVAGADGTPARMAAATCAAACGHRRSDAPGRSRARQRAHPAPSAAGHRPCRSDGGHARHHCRRSRRAGSGLARALRQRARGRADAHPQRFLSAPDRCTAGHRRAQTRRWARGSAAATRWRDRPDHSHTGSDGRAALRRRPQRRRPPGRCAARCHRTPARCLAVAAAPVACPARTAQRRRRADVRGVWRAGRAGRRAGASCRTDVSRIAFRCAGRAGRGADAAERDPPRQRCRHRAACAVVGTAGQQRSARAGGCVRACAPVRQRAGGRRAGLCGRARSLVAAMAARSRVDP